MLKLLLQIMLTHPLILAHKQEIHYEYTSIVIAHSLYFYLLTFKHTHTLSFHESSKSVHTHPNTSMQEVKMIK